MANSDRATREETYKQALLKATDTIRQLLEENAALQKREPVAVVGMACRFPGGANSPEQYWQLLHDRVDAITDVPATRWPAETYYAADHAAPGKMYTVRGGFLDIPVEDFDAGFFGISPREACALDPQHRLLLEISWEALEHACLDPTHLKNSKTGVFVGISSDDYAQAHRHSGQPERIDAYSITGTTFSTAAGRLSYTLGLQGPCIALDTACSSSLVALHLACQSLRSRESNLALAGGVNLILSPQSHICFSKLQTISPDGKCKSFDASADGYVRGEGCGVLVLKRLRDALKDGNRILAVVRGSAINQDGKTNGLAAPNGNAQQAVIRHALEDAGIQPTQVDYIEAHGTGTVLGDPIEVEALGAVFGPGRTEPLRLGTVKTNIGHLEPAAGVAGLIKIILSLQHEELAQNLHFHRPNPYIAWERLPLQVVSERSTWKRSDRPRLAGVSSFGFSGTNAHVIVEEAPALPPHVEARESDSYLLSVSARDEHALRTLATEYVTLLSGEARGPGAIGDVCFAASVGRRHWPQRLAIEGTDKNDLHRKLTSFLQSRDEPGIITGSFEEEKSPNLAFLFTGQGSQYPGMGRGLYQSQAIFKQAIDQCDALLQPFIKTSLVQLLFAGEAEALNQTIYAQPTLFALEYALFQLWESWGIKPNVVMGHSVGEYVAACVAGVFSLEDGIRLIAERGRLMQALPSGGSMAAVFAAPELVAAVVAPYGGRIDIAAYNGPQHVVISGETKAVQEVCTVLASKGIRTTLLSVSHAFHSHLMEPMMAAYEQIARQVAFSLPRIKLISNLTGEAAGAEIASPHYWVNHIRQPVAFAAGMKTLLHEGIHAFVELGSQPTLLSMGRHCIAKDDTDKSKWLPSLRPQVPDLQLMYRSLGALYVSGAPMNWSGVYGERKYRWTTLPSYPFQRQRYWIDSVRPTASRSQTGLGATEHPLLGRRLRLPALTKGEVRYEHELDSGSFVRDHRVFQRAILPAAAYVEMALAAASRNSTSSRSSVVLCLQDVTIQQALVLAEGQNRTIQLVMTPDTAPAAGSSDQFQIYSLCEDETGQEPTWTLHAKGHISHSASSTSPPRTDLEAAQVECANEIAIVDFYQQCRTRGLEYGPDFQALQRLWQGKSQALGLIQLPEGVVEEAAHYHIHPVLLDACLQTLLVTFPDSSKNETWLPIGLERFQLYRSPGTQLWCHARLQVVEEAGQPLFRADLCLLDATGETIAVLEGLRAKKADPTLLLGDQPDLENWLYGVEWRPQGLCHPRENAPRLPAPSELQEELRREMAALANQFQLDDYGKALAELDKLCVLYVVAALGDMGHVFRLREQFSTAELAARLGVVPTHQQLFNRLLAMLVEEGILRAHQTGWEVLRVPEGPAPKPVWQSLRSRYPQVEIELDLVQRCAVALADVLQGRCDPLSQLLFPGGDGSAVAALYRQTPAAEAVHAVLRQGLLTALNRLPQRSGLRIVEIGAGTGGTTAALLPHLPAARTEYVFTDISTAFATQAEATFADYPFVQYATLDIEKDPHAQGFAPQGYDIVVAANVLHATEDVAQTVQHIQRLLAPGGMVLLLEGTAPQRWIDVVFGMTSGWWRFRDTDLRPAHPLLSAPQWCEVLRTHGFQQTVSIDCTPIRQSVLVAQADKIPDEQQESEHWLIFADAGEIGHELREQVRARGSRCTLVRPGSHYEPTTDDAFTIDPYEPAHYQQLFAGLGTATLHHCVYLWGLDTTRTSDTTASLVAAARMGWEGTLLVVQALAHARLAPRLSIVTRGAISVAGEALPGIALSPVWGMGKSIALEHPELHCLRIDLAAEPQADEVSALMAELSQGVSQQTEDQIALRGEYRYVARLTRCDVPTDRTNAELLKLPQTESYGLGIPEWGKIEAVEWRPTPQRAPKSGEVEIMVRAAGFNFKDVLIALGMVPASGSILGGECAGEVIRVGPGVTNVKVGEAVMAMAPGSFARYVTVPATAVARIPIGLSFAAAATLPIAFLTTLYALEEIGQVRAGERVLIHAASGGVGQAAIQVAQRAGAEVWATASETKWEALRRLGVREVLNSRTPAFGAEIKRRTHGVGVDIVLNSLRGELTTESLKLVRAGGRFVELGIRDIRSAAEVTRLAPGAQYTTLDLLEEYTKRPPVIERLMSEIVRRVEAGELHPLPYREYGVEGVREALQVLLQATHTGKLVLSFPPPTRPQFRNDGTYLITGGLGGLGLLTAGWMAEHGAGHLVLASRRSLTPEIEEQIATLKQTGTEVTVFQTDVASGKQVGQLLTTIEHSLPPLRGIIHAAGILDDGILLEQDRERFRKVLVPKVDGAWHLHQQTHTLPLDFFLLFSSATSLLGAVGQSNHVSANAFLDALAYHRRAQGLPALSINWGAWSEIGYAAQVQAEDFLKAQGVGSIAPRWGVAALERIFHAKQAQIGVIQIDWPTYLQRTTPSSYLSDFLPAKSVQPEQRAEFRQLLETTPAAEQRVLLANYVTSQLATVLRFSASTRIDPKQGFSDMGMDSLTAVELRNSLQTDLGCTLPSTLIFDFPNVAAVVDYVATEVLKIHSIVGSPTVTENVGITEDLQILERLSEAEAETTLLRELEELEERGLSS